MSLNVLNGLLLHLLEGENEKTLEQLDFLLCFLVVKWPEINKSKACVTSFQLRFFVFEEFEQLLLLILEIIESANRVGTCSTLLLLG